MDNMCNKDIECLPIKSLEELKNWKDCNSEEHSTYPLEKRASVKDWPKTLVCHDMKGGYLDDRFHNGSETEDNYYFIHWSIVDIFVYFSHNLVTIPPCGWITAAHRNGVKVLGTFITEWDEGVKVCESMLSDETSVRQICQQLVSIANLYNFDGWLINIENKLNSNQVSLLEEFVRFLTIKMHELQSESVVIWYDSIIQTGELKWQNELNENNRSFFDVCDGIFLNYNWKQDNLKKSVENAGCRKTDVYVGVDVFGRGCLGGGGFSTDIAVTAARDFNLSVAIFAPGWVYECLDKKDFKENQYKYWNSLTELCYIRPIMCNGATFYTSFCPGFGKKMFKNGKIISSKSWYNISLQQLQPSFHYTNCSSHESMVTLYNEDSFNGGGCLQLKVMKPKANESVMFKILSTNFHIYSDVCVSFTSKSVDIDEINLVLNVCLKSEKSEKTFPVYFFSDLQEVEKEQKLKVSSDKCHFPDKCRDILSSVEGAHWIERQYYWHIPDKQTCIVKDINIEVFPKKTSDAEISVLIGELSITPHEQLPCKHLKKNQSCSCPS